MPSQSEDMPDRLAVMIERQRQLQEQHMFNGTSFADMSVLDRVRYLKDMVLAIDNELHAEVLNEFTWKPWDKSQPTIHEEHLLRELVDVWHFLMNLMWATYPQDTPAELARRFFLVYTDKWEVNVERQRAGYTNNGKCPLCTRALDDVGIADVHDEFTERTGLDVVMCLGCQGTFPRSDIT